MHNAVNFDKSREVNNKKGNDKLPITKVYVCKKKGKIGGMWAGGKRERVCYLWPPSKWSKWLPWPKLSYNIAYHSSTKNIYPFWSGLWAATTLCHSLPSWFICSCQGWCSTPRPETLHTLKATLLQTTLLQTQQWQIQPIRNGGMWILTSMIGSILN